MLNPAVVVRQLEFYWNGLDAASGTPAPGVSAKSFFQKELKEARRVNDRGAMARITGLLSHGFIRSRQFKDARRFAMESLEWAESLRDDGAMGCANHLLGDIAYARGRMEDANLFYHRGWDAYVKTGDKKGEAWSYTRMGMAALRLGLRDEAVRLYKKSFELFEPMDDSPAIAWNKNCMGMASGYAGLYMKAFKTHQEALELYQAHSDIRGQAWTLELMGNMRLAMKNDEEAEKLYRQARALFSAQGSDLAGAAWHHFHIGAVYLLRKNNEDAKDELDKALSLFDQLGDPLGQAAVLEESAGLACIRKNLPGAKEALRRGVKLTLAGPAHPLLTDMLAMAARYLKAQGEDQKAMSLSLILLSQPACCQSTKDQLVDLAVELEPDFTYEAADKRFRWAKEADLEAMAKTWLASLNKTVFGGKKSRVTKRKKTRRSPAKARKKKS